MNSGPLFATNTFVWALAAICQLHRRPFAPNLVLQQFPPPYSAASLQQAAKSLKLKTGMRVVKALDFESLPQPFLAILSPSQTSKSSVREPTSSSARHSGLAVVLRCDRERVLYITEDSNAPNAA